MTTDTVVRIRVDNSGNSYPSPDGYYVAYTDYAALLAEVAELRANERIMFDAGVAQEQELMAAERRAEAAEANDARYRWLREQPHQWVRVPCPDGIAHCLTLHRQPATGDSLDFIADAALSRAQGTE